MIKLELINSNLKGWHFAADRGGTFTDLIALSPNLELFIEKILSNSPYYSDAACEGINRILLKSNLKNQEIESLKIGTTVATNSLLENNGSKVGLIINKGFEDLFLIGNQKRNELFNLNIKPKPIFFEKVIGISGRINSEGKEEEKIDFSEIDSSLMNLNESCECICVVLLHSWKNNIHEQEIINRYKHLGHKPIYLSSEISNLRQFLERGNTALIESFLSKPIQKYQNNLKRNLKKLKDPDVHIMQSSGGLVPLDKTTGIDSLLSGPVGGLKAMSFISKQLNIEEILGFDMGGTSTDVSRFHGDFHRKFTSNFKGHEFFSDRLDIETIASGGGSLLKFVNGRLQVGPDSAGSNPGPACYRNNGPLTLSDANLILGKLDPDFFPKIFGKNQNLALDFNASKTLFEKLSNKIKEQTGKYININELAHGFCKIAEFSMCRALKKVSVSRGYDLRKHSLLCFGGASAQHAASIASFLGINKVIIHPCSSILSAYGIFLSENLSRKSKSILRPFNRDTHTSIIDNFDSFFTKMFKIKINKNFLIKVFFDIRVSGRDSFLSIYGGNYEEFLNFKNLKINFLKRHFELYSFHPDEINLEFVNIRIEKSLNKYLFKENISPISNKLAMPIKFKEVFHSGIKIKVPVFKLEEISQNKQIGPALILNSLNTIWVPPDFNFYKNKYNYLILESNQLKTKNIKSDPISLEIFYKLFESIANQMGETLSQAAHSVNIKERQDFSCALFDIDGNLIANAPHVPVHLGSMGQTVKYIISKYEKIIDGQAYLINNPYCGGSHLPDLTLISPIFNNSKLVAFVANRGHHADIGGIRAGSMPPFSSSIEEEGICFSGEIIAQKNILMENLIINFLTKKPYPARNIKERISDLQAQLAANIKGISEFKNAINNFGIDSILLHMKLLRLNSADCLNKFIVNFLAENKKFEAFYSSHLDEGSKICLKTIIEINNKNMGSIIFDFSGSSDELNGNLNCPPAVCRAAILYCLRCLINEEIPLNDGFLNNVKIVIPEKSILNPSFGKAVVGGNVETSQRIVDTIFSCLNICASSQGTMNNFLFGDFNQEGKQYYETIGGGMGALKNIDGASASQVHMTNTKITDCEILEDRFKFLRLKEFSVRKNSGGSGKFKGGNGIIRHFHFKKAQEVSILSENRENGPRGLGAGNSGKAGKNILILEDGTKKLLGGKAEVHIMPGQEIRIETPGGGGFS